MVHGRFRVHRRLRVNRRFRVCGRLRHHPRKKIVKGTKAAVGTVESIRGIQRDPAGQRHLTVAQQRRPGRNLTAAGHDHPGLLGVFRQPGADLLQQTLPQPVARVYQGHQHPGTDASPAVFIAKPQLQPVTEIFHHIAQPVNPPALQPLFLMQPVKHRFHRVHLAQHVAVQLGLGDAPGQMAPLGGGYDVVLEKTPHTLLLHPLQQLAGGLVIAALHPVFVGGGDLHYIAVLDGGIEIGGREIRRLGQLFPGKDHPVREHIQQRCELPPPKGILKLLAAGTLQTALALHAQVIRSVPFPARPAALFFRNLRPFRLLGPFPFRHILLRGFRHGFGGLFHRFCLGFCLGHRRRRRFFNRLGCLFRHSFRRGFCFFCRRLRHCFRLLRLLGRQADGSGVHARQQREAQHIAVPGHEIVARAVVRRVQTV